MDAPAHERKALDGFFDTGHVLGTRRLADEEAAHLDHEEDRDEDEHDADREAAEPVPARVVGDPGQHDADEGDRQSHERGGVLEQHHRQIGALGAPDETKPALVLGPHVVRLVHRGPQRERLEHHCTEQHRDRPAQRLDRVGFPELLDAFEDGEDAAEREEHERDDERVEVLNGPVAERVSLVGGPVRAPASQQQQALVAGVRERVDRLGEHRRRPGEDERDELHHRNADVREERGDDRALGVAVLRHYSMMPPRVIDSTSSARSSSSSVMSLRARTISRIDLPVRLDSLMISPAFS